MLLTSKDGPEGEGDGAEGQQVADGLGGAPGANDVEGDGPQKGDEAAVEEPHAKGQHEEEPKVVPRHQ